MNSYLKTQEGDGGIWEVWLKLKANTQKIRKSLEIKLKKMHIKRWKNIRKAKQNDNEGGMKIL